MLSRFHSVKLLVKVCLGKSLKNLLLHCKLDNLLDMMPEMPYNVIVIWLLTSNGTIGIDVSLLKIYDVVLVLN